MPGKRFFDRIQAALNLQRDRDALGQHPPAEPVQHGSQVDKVVCHWNVRETLSANSGGRLFQQGGTIHEPAS